VQKKPSSIAERLFVTDEPEFSNHFLQDLKSLAVTAENIFKKVQGKLEE
jgi:hypothetical protein